MAEPLADQIIRKISQAAELYHRLLLVVAPAGAGKTAALHAVRDRSGALLVNVNLELSRNQTVVAAWNGTIVDYSLTYAVPDHPEYRRYPMRAERGRGFLVAGSEVTT